MSTHLRIAAIGGMAGVLLALAGQVAPPLHVLTHELVAAVCIVGAIVIVHLGPLAWRWTAAGPDRLGEALRSTLGAVVTFAAGTQGVSLIANLQHGCDTLGTGLFLWVTWLPLGLLAAVAGLAAARSGRGFWARCGILLVATLLAIAHDELQARIGTRIVDPLLGVQDWLSQRASMGLPRVHYLQRTWLLGVGCAAYATLAWRHHGAASWRRAALWAWLGVAAATLGFGSRIGVGFDRSALFDVLDGERRSPHFRIHYDRGSKVRHELDAVVRTLEWELHRLATAWQIPTDGLVVTVYLFDDRDALSATTGHRNAHANTRRIALPLRDVYDDTLPHELVHAVDQEVGTPWYRIGWNRGISEGSATAWGGGYAEQPEAHGTMAAALEQGTLPSAATVMGPLGFVQVAEHEAYRVAGSFIGWLILTEGIEPWQQLMIQWDVEAVYGRSLEELDADWRAFLAQVPRVLSDDRYARNSFGQSRYPAYRARQCPKLGEAEPDLPQEASDAARADAHALALQHYETLLADGFEERWATGRLSALQDLDRHEEALAALEALPESDQPDVQAARLQSRLLSLAFLGRVDAFREAVDAALALEPNRAFETLRPLLDDPAAAADAVAIYSERFTNSWGVGAELLRMVEQYPEHADALERLHLQWATRWHMSRPSDEAVVRENLDRLRRRPGACEASTLRWRAQELVKRGRCDLAVEMLEALPSCAGQEEHTAEQLRARIAWERQPDPALPKPCADSVLAQ